MRSLTAPVYFYYSLSIFSNEWFYYLWLVSYCDLYFVLKYLAFRYLCGHVCWCYLHYSELKFFLILRNAHSIMHLSEKLAVNTASYSWFYAHHFCENQVLSFSLTGMFINKPLQLWFSSVYCLRRKLQKAHGFLTAIFGYVWCSGHEPVLFYANRIAFIDYTRKTVAVVTAKAELYISVQLLPCIQTYFETTLKHLHCSALVCMVAAIQCRLLDFFKVVSFFSCTTWSESTYVCISTRTTSFFIFFFF